MSEGTTLEISLSKPPRPLADICIRSNIFVFLTRSSIWSKINSRISRRVEEGVAPCNEVGEIGAEVVLEVEEDVGEAEVEEAESRRSAIYEVANRAASTPFLAEK